MRLFGDIHDEDGPPHPDNNKRSRFLKRPKDTGSCLIALLCRKLR
jgi:hypothetical protein